LQTLRCPLNDIAGLGRLLASEKHGAYQITEIRDGTHWAGRRAIYQVLKNAARGDVVLIYYSGHGKLDEDGNLYLATRDTEVEALPPTSIPAADIKTYIAESSVSTVIVIFDCCFSGSIRKFFKGPVADQATQAVKEFEGAGVCYLSASTDTQLAEEKDTDNFSLLTKHLVAGIAEGSADLNGDGRVSFQELCRYVQATVPLEGTQRPKSWFLEAEGEITVALTGKPAYQNQRNEIARKLYEMASQDLITDRVVSNILDFMDQTADPLSPERSRLEEVVQSLHPLLDKRGLFLQKAIELSSSLERSPAIRSEALPPATPAPPEPQAPSTLRILPNPIQEHQGALRSSVFLPTHDCRSNCRASFCEPMGLSHSSGEE